MPELHRRRRRRMLSLSRGSCADLYAKDGIRCNSVAPGPTLCRLARRGGLADLAATTREGMAGDRRRRAAARAARHGRTRSPTSSPSSSRHGPRYVVGTLRGRVDGGSRVLLTASSETRPVALRGGSAYEDRAGAATTLGAWRSQAGSRTRSTSACERSRSARCRRSPSARTRRAGASAEEEPCRVRTPFQRDRDRIVHSKPFRRLKGKTQVFIDPEGDHYRTRMTHTLETTGDLARRRPRAPAERGSDRGDRARPRHGPHAVRPRRRGGARRGRCASASAARFRHNEQSLPDRASALNLTHEVRDGILTHTGEREPETLEGKIVRHRRPRRLHQPRHRRRGALRDPRPRATCPRDEIELLGPTGSKRIDTLVHDIVESSERAGDIVQSDEVGDGDALAARVHVRARLPRARRRRRARARPRRRSGAIFDALVETRRAAAGRGRLGRGSPTTSPG